MTEQTRKKAVDYLKKVRQKKEKEINDKKHEVILKLEKIRQLTEKNKLSNNPETTNMINGLKRHVQELERDIDFLTDVLEHDTLVETSLEFSYFDFFRNDTCEHDVWIFFGKHPSPCDTGEIYRFYCLDCEKEKLCTEENVREFREKNKVIDYLITDDDWFGFLFGQPDADINILQLQRNKYFKLLEDYTTEEAIEILRKDAEEHSSKVPQLNFPTTLEKDCSHDTWYLLNKCISVSILCGDKYTDDDELTNIYKCKCMDCSQPARFIQKSQYDIFCKTFNVLDFKLYGWSNFYEVRSRYLELLKTHSKEESLKILEEEFGKKSKTKKKTL